APAPPAAEAAERAPLVAKVEHFYATAPDAERLFRFFRDSLGLAEVWAFRSYGDFASGGVSLGNVVFEQATWKPDDGGRLPTELSGIALEPGGGTDALVAELARRGVRHDRPDSNVSTSSSGRRLGWVNTGLTGMLPDPRAVFFCDYADRATIAANRQKASDALAASRGGPLGVVALREIVVGAPDTAAARAEWRRLLDDPSQERDGAFHFGAGPAVRVAPARERSIVRLVLRVRALSPARAFLRGRGWLAAAARGRVAVAPAAAAGLDIRLEE
ncbi:hypothetical protein, partial [Roseisolibacter sp. H3M3-2]|uniref:hypothetical protein n=1 Tax=Roseisolibacter sp. H3M3-2 TaxID=3031323 RepID=UPI0023DAEDBB